MTSFNLGDNRIGHTGIIAITEGLAINKGLRHLCLINNIGDAGIAALAQTVTFVRARSRGDPHDLLIHASGARPW